MIHVLDTHAIVWALEDSPQLPPAAKRVMLDPSAMLVVPTIALAEIWHLHQRRRVRPSLLDVKSLMLNAGNCVVQPLDEDVLGLLPAGFEIHDAIIVATALLYRQAYGEDVRLITCDREIAESRLIAVLW